MLDRLGLAGKVANLYDCSESDVVPGTNNYNKRLLHGHRLDDMAAEQCPEARSDARHEASFLSWTHTTGQNQNR